MPIVKYRTLASRGTPESFESIYGLLWHMAPYALELKGLSAVGQPESGYIIELSDAFPAIEPPHLGLELIG